MTNRFFYLENKNALCSNYAVDEAYFWSNSKDAVSVGFETSETSNSDIFKPNCLPVASACLPIPIIVFSSYGWRYLEKPGILSYPRILGFFGLESDITKNGSTCLNVTI